MKSIRKIYFILPLLALWTTTACLDNGDDSGFDPATPEISFGQGSLIVSQMGGEQVITINSNLPWRLKSDTPWVVISKGSGLSAGEAVFTVQRNRTREERLGSITAYITDECQTVLNLIQLPAAATETFNYYVKTNGNPESDGLTWETATTLPTAMESAADGDIISLAAGVYTPVTLLTGGEEQREMTFEIHSNFTLEGGYPADAMTGATPDPASNETVLSGNIGAGVAAYHVVTVTASKSLQNQAALKNLTISGGVTYTTNETLRRVVGGALIDAGLGGGLFVGNSNLQVTNCRITDNEGCHAGGVYLYVGANVSMENCVISNNKATNNGGGIWNAGGVLYMNRCTVSNNTAGQQAAGFYSIDSGGSPTVSRIYNSTISDNDNTLAANRSGGGAYIREGSDAVFVNCTFSGNKTGYGGGIMGYGSASRPSKTVCISCTITGNRANGAAGGGGVIVYNANGAVSLYNTIVSGNESSSGPADAGLAAGLDASLLKVISSINGTQLFDNNGGGVGGWSFSSSTMLGAFGLYNGGITRTYPLVAGESNPAIGQGMTAAQLREQAALHTPAVADEIVSADQNGTARSGRSIGATTAQ